VFACWPFRAGPAGSGKAAVIVEPIHNERVTATDGQLFEGAATDAGFSVNVANLPGPRPMQVITLEL
jgi:hypothetical protein